MREGTALTTVTPINANFNPADAAINENKYQLAAGYSSPMGWGTLATTASKISSIDPAARAATNPTIP